MHRRAPRVTIAIPMYRSERYLDGLLDNLDSINYSNLELLFSDQHLLDTAADQVRSHYAGQSNVRVLQSQDGLGWSDNYNLLLRQATGEYFRWLAHDDRLPSEGLEGQVRQLEEAREAICVACPFERINAHGKRIQLEDASRIHPVPEESPWRFQHALEILGDRRYGGAFKGLWRRAALVENRLFIRPTLDFNRPERLWLFAAALLGRILYDASYVYQKQIHAESVSAQWETRFRHRWSHFRTAYGYLRDIRGRQCAAATSPLLAALLLLYHPAIRVLRPFAKVRQASR